jgi:hypothetical protein
MADSKNAWMSKERRPRETQYARETEKSVRGQKNLERRREEGGERRQIDGRREVGFYCASKTLTTATVGDCNGNNITTDASDMVLIHDDGKIQWHCQISHSKTEAAEILLRRLWNLPTLREHIQERIHGRCFRLQRQLMYTLASKSRGQASPVVETFPWPNCRHPPLRDPSQRIHHRICRPQDQTHHHGEALP